MVSTIPYTKLLSNRWRRVKHDHSHLSLAVKPPHVRRRYDHSLTFLLEIGLTPPFLCPIGHNNRAERLLIQLAKTKFTMLSVNLKKSHSGIF